MKKICVVTGTRAEYGLLYWLIKGLDAEETIQMQLCVTGMHLSPEFGNTFRQIEKDGFQIDKKVEMLLSSDTAIGIGKSIGLGVIGFSEAFAELSPNLVVLLGDRFEILAAATSAMIAKIPIAHCHGGEATEGLIDEAIRHSITKMSQVHFVSTEEYKNRVIQLGEQPARVFNVGALGIENINKLQLYQKETFLESIDFKLAQENVLVTFHPVTLEDATAERQFKDLLKALDELHNCNIIFTKPNADTDGRIIIELIDNYVRQSVNKAVSFTSLGQLRYLSALQYMSCVVGNSSSGLIEVPSFRIPTVNIGDRQRGRIKASSIIDCTPDYESIKKAIEKALSKDFKEVANKTSNPYDRGNASEQIVSVIKGIDLKQIVKKKFYDIQ